MYSAFGSFYIPSCIMVFVYIKIYYAARDRARRNIKARRKSRRSRRAAAANAVNLNKANVVVNKVNSNPPPPALPQPAMPSNGEKASLVVKSGELLSRSPGGTLQSALKKKTSLELQTTEKKARVSFTDDNNAAAVAAAAAAAAVAPKDEKIDDDAAAEKETLLDNDKPKKVASIESVPVDESPLGRIQTEQVADKKEADKKKPIEMEEVKKPLGPHPYGACLANGLKSRRSVGVSTRTDEVSFSSSEDDDEDDDDDYDLDDYDSIDDDDEETMGLEEPLPRASSKRRKKKKKKKKEEEQGPSKLKVHVLRIRTRLRAAAALKAAAAAGSARRERRTSKEVREVVDTGKLRRTSKDPIAKSTEELPPSAPSPPVVVTIPKVPSISSSAPVTPSISSAPASALDATAIGSTNGNSRANSLSVDATSTSPVQPQSGRSPLRFHLPIGKRNTAPLATTPTTPATAASPNMIATGTNGVKNPITEAEREKRRIARKKERRATLILGLIMGSFIACWLPFFFLYSISPICPICEESPEDAACCVHAWGFSFAFWLGYSNSALNPVIYTIFNKDFRRAFKRILFK